MPKSGSRNRVVSDFLENPSEQKMKDLVGYALSNDFHDQDILELAIGLANSGRVIDNKDETEVYDIPSTGGPSSLSTLLCPLFLRSFGKTVLKIGVPGRPAGGIDVLAQIKGYDTVPSENQVKSWFKSNRYVHFLANENFVPLDAKLFHFRRKNDAIAIPALVIASLLSKKIAAGITHLGLDIRVSEFGNFGRTWEEARENSYRFNRLSELYGIKSKCFLTNGDMPQQPYIGRGESILALGQIFNANAETALKTHLQICNSIASSISQSVDTFVSLNSLQSFFIKNIQTQGGSIDSFEEIANTVKKNHSYFIKSSQDGYLKIKLDTIRDAIVKFQKMITGVFPDPCGIILKTMSNEYVRKGDILCSFRCPDKFLIGFEKSLLTAFEFITEMTNKPEFEEV